MAENSKFGLKIGVEGEKEFKNALSEINQSFKVLGSEMQLVSSQFDKNDKSVEAVTARNKALNKEIDTQKDKVSVLEKALANSAESFGENDKRTQNWQIQLNKAQAELNGMERELGENEKALSGVGGEMKDTGKEAGKLGDEFGDTGETADEAGGKFEKLGDVVKGIGIAVGAAMAAIGAATVAAGKALYDMANDAAAAGDRVDKASQKLGLSAEAYQEWDYVLSQNGASIDSLGAGMKTLQKTMDGLTEDGDKASESFKKIGINFDDIKDKSPEEAFDMTVKALQNMPPGAEKSAAAMKLLGKQGMELMPLLNQTADSTDALKQKANDLGMVMSGDAVGASAAFTDSMDTLQRTFTGMKNSIGAELLPGMTMVIDGFVGIISGSDGAAASIEEGVKFIIAQIGEMLPRMLELFTSIVTVISSIAPELISALITGITENIPVLVTAAGGLINALLDSIVAAIPALTGAAVQIIVMIGTSLIAEAPRLLEAAAAIVSNLAKGLGNAVPILKPIMTVISGLMTALQKLTPFILAAAAAFGTFQIVMTIANAIKAMTAATSAQSIATAAHTVVMTVWSTVTGVATGVMAAFNAMMAANPIGLVVAAIAALVVGVIALIGWLNRETEEQKALKKSTEDLVEANEKLIESTSESAAAYEDKIKGMQYEAEAAESLADRIAELAAVEDKSTEQKERLAAYVDMLNEAMGESIVQYDMENDAMSRNVDEIYNILTARQEEAKAQAARERAVEIAKEQMAVEDQLVQIEKQREALAEALADGVYKKGEKDKKYKEVVDMLNKSESELVERQSELADSFESTTKVVAESAAKQAEANAAIIESAEEVVDAMTEAYKTQEEIAQKRAEVEKELTDAMIIEANAQGLTLDEYKKKLQEMQKDEEEIIKQREKTLESYTKSATEMFKQISETSDVSVTEMTTNLEHNQRVIGEWAENIAVLAEMGIDEGLLQKLEDAGPESAGLVKTLVNSSEEELEKLSDTFANGSKVATDALLTQLGMPNVTNSGSDMVDKIAGGVDNNNSLTKSTEKLITTAKSTAADSVIKNDFISVGESIVDGVWQGFSNKEATFRSQVLTFFKKIVGDVKSELGIQSPSTVFAEVGKNMALGVGVGFGDQMNKVADDMQNAIPMDLDMPDFDIFGGVADSRKNSPGTNAPVYIYTTVELDKKAVGHSVTPVVSQDLAFAARGGRF